MSTKPAGGPRSTGVATSWSLPSTFTVYCRLAEAVPAPRRPEIQDLSKRLRSAGLHPNFRSPASVVMKLMNFRFSDIIASVEEGGLASLAVPGRTSHTDPTENRG